MFTRWHRAFVVLGQSAWMSSCSATGPRTQRERQIEGKRPFALKTTEGLFDQSEPEVRISGGLLKTAGGETRLLPNTQRKYSRPAFCVDATVSVFRPSRTHKLFMLSSDPCSLQTECKQQCFMFQLPETAVLNTPNTFIQFKQVKEKQKQTSYLECFCVRDLILFARKYQRLLLHY